ncbi:MAG: ribonuclease D [Nannocystaceae bacterium]
MPPQAPVQREFAWLDDPAGVERLARALCDAKWYALDSESNSMFAYRERVCLVQLNVEGSLYVIDPLGHSDTARLCAPLRSVLEDHHRTCFLHGGEYDVACFKREFGIALRGVFDTQQAASFLGWPKTGYAAVVETVTGVVLPKSHAQYDWSTRPLDPAALQYALDDVFYLPEAALRLKEELVAADLGAEVAVANEAVMDALPHDNAFRASNIYRVKGFKELDTGAQPRALALYLWRDHAARDLDMPPGRLLNDRALVALARADPASREQLRKQRLGGRINGLVTSLLTCLEQARTNPPDLPDVEKIPRNNAAARGRADRLKRWRREEATLRNVPLQVVLPARALAHLQLQGADDLDNVPQLGAVRIQRYAGHLRRLCR